MKRRFRAAVLLLVLTVLLTTVVFADSGPKPQLAVRVVHAPQEAYYLDLLDEGTYTGAYETDETGLDPALLQAFRAAIPSGWHGFISQEADDDGKDRVKLSVLRLLFAGLNQSAHLGRPYRAGRRKRRDASYVPLCRRAADVPDSDGDAVRRSVFVRRFAARHPAEHRDG